MDVEGLRPRSSSRGADHVEFAARLDDHETRLTRLERQDES